MRSISSEAFLLSPDPSSYLPHRTPFLYIYTGSPHLSPASQPLHY